jgi:hypothetical protein
VAWRKRLVVRKDMTRNQVERGTPKGREETVEGPGVQNWNKEPWHKATAASENQENTIWVRHEGLRTRIREASKRDIQRVAESEKLDPVEESSPPPETDEETIRVFSIRSAGNVGAPATGDSFALPLKKKKKKKNVG